MMFRFLTILINDVHLNVFLGSHKTFFVDITEKKLSLVYIYFWTNITTAIYFEVMWAGGESGRTTMKFD